MTNNFFQNLSSQEIEKILTGIKGTLDNSLLDQKQFIERLFTKAPEIYLKTRRTEDLIKITKNSLKTIGDSIESGNGLAINYELDKFARIWIAQGDRPFIVNTLTEILKDYACEINVILHPIVEANSIRLSTAYLEIASITKEVFEELLNDIRQSLDYLVDVTTDYSHTLIRLEKLASQIDDSVSAAPDAIETAEFIRWLSDGCFVFLGAGDWNLQSKKIINPLGLLNNQGFARNLESELCADYELSQENYFNISRLQLRSPIHRRAQISHLVINDFDERGKLQSSLSIIGLFTSKAFDQQSRNIPIIRKRLEKVLELEEVYENSFDYKSIINIIDSMPKDEILKMDLESLRHSILTILSIQDQNETKLSIRFDRLKRGVSVLVLIPRDHFNTSVRDSIQKYLENTFKTTPGSSEYRLDYQKGSHARLYFYIPIGAGINTDIDLLEMEQTVANLSRNWESDLKHQIISSFPAEKNETILDKFSKAFSSEYQAINTVEQAIADINFMLINDISYEQKIRLELGQDTRLVFYSSAPHMSLSQALPSLENSGFSVLTESSCELNLAGETKIYIRRFSVQPKSEINSDYFEQYYAPGMLKVFKNEAPDDVLNSLLLFAGIDLKAIALLRCYCDYLWQINKFAARSIIFNSFASEPEISLIFWRAFELKFNPNNKKTKEERIKKFEELENLFLDRLRAISDISVDRILRSVLELLKNTLRTNFYTEQEALAIKIDAANTSIISEPRPLYEVFVSSNSMQGIHLRSSKVSRGGIRWSDRHQDYRVEVMGLMRTQKIKNALIVPTGAKGGFVVKNPPKDNKLAFEAAKVAYQSYVRALLSITDNYKDSIAVTPKHVIAYDTVDPYFVVAADKGTATFSDIANKIAVEEFNFWLGDAFASGGSKGYDHKAYGITAKGAWECVVRHFNDLGIDYLNSNFTAIGIGDMSGDVFGNGLLLSRNFQLLAAFNHKHIFIDPNPDSEKSFSERERLFKLAGSQWSDYNPELISKGGGIFNRYDKEIKISKEIRKALTIPDEIKGTINGEQLITLILKAKVDLIWNGGIGTYFKAYEESNSDVNDSANDQVRINASEIRARVVGEGGNLGFTQRARIEYARSGGHGNTDAIDNSGGVDMSDHEVNLKILFSAAINSGKISLAERDQLLLQIAEDVNQRVLRHNHNQALVISIGERRSYLNRHYLASLIREVVKGGYVTRRLDVLPEDEELNNRARKQIGLYRPELAVLLAATKLHIKESVKGTNLVKDAYLEGLLFDYFPTALHAKFKDEISNHALRNDIISTELANHLVDAVGISFIHRMCIKHSLDINTVIKSSLAAIEILMDRKIKQELSIFDTPKNSELYMSLGYQLGIAVRELTSWMIKTHSKDLHLGEMISSYSSAYVEIMTGTTNLFQEAGEVYASRLAKCRDLNLSEFATQSMLGFPRILAIFEILWCAKLLKKPAIEIAGTFIELYKLFEIDKITASADKIIAANKWELELVTSSNEDVLRNISLLTMHSITTSTTTSDLQNSIAYQSFKQTADEINRETLNIASLSALARASKQLTEDLKNSR